MDIYVSCHSDNDSTTSPNLRIDGFFDGITGAIGLAAFVPYAAEAGVKMN